MIYLIWLQNVLGFSNKRAYLALKEYKNAETIYNLTESQLKNSKIFTKKDIELISNKDLSSAKNIIRECNENNIEIICFGDKKYPLYLSEIDNPPIVLYIKGNLPNFNEKPSVAIVGSRDVSEFGKRAAYSLGYRLAKLGFIVVSGGALGTDTYAHAGALKAGGETVLCMGCGILSNYLIKNKDLRNNVTLGGCLLTEYSPNTSASKYNFPIRNRIMSGLTLGTIVIEAKEKSGSLITARLASEQGRDVFVVPNIPGDPYYIGSNALLRDGAKPLLDISDVYNEYISRFPDKINIENAYSQPIIVKKSVVETKNNENNEKIQKNLNETLSKEAKIVYNYLDKQKFVPEDFKNSGLSASQILSALTELEMEFLIKAVPGGMYEKCEL